MALPQTLKDLLSQIPGVQDVYFQPPADLKMNYPCIRFERDFAATQYADNRPHRHTKRYKITYISRDPDDGPVVNFLMRLPMCSFDRHFKADGLNHDVYNLYF